MQNRLKKRKVRKQVRYSCYKRINKISGIWEYIRVNSMRFNCKSNNYKGTLPLQTRNYIFEYIGEWDKSKYSNIEDEIEAVQPPSIEIPDELPAKPKTTRRTRKKKAEDE